MTRHAVPTVFMLLAALCAGPDPACAATGPASVYKVTVIKFELYNGTSWVTVSSGNSTVIDIAAATAGQTAGTFFSGLSVPDGSYTQVRVTPSDTFIVSGRVGSNYTTATISNGGCAVTGVAANEAQCTVNVPAPGIGTPNPDVLPTTLTVTNGTPSHKIRVDFNVNTAIQDGGPLGELFPNQPVVTITMVAL